MTDFRRQKSEGREQKAEFSISDFGLRISELKKG
jgi:hypothetical protein